MKGSKTLSQAVDRCNFVHDKINLITTPCGSGKTYFALNTLNAEDWFAGDCKVFLIDTIKGKNQILKQYPNAIVIDKDYFYRYPNLREVFGVNTDQVVIMCYQTFGILATNGCKGLTRNEFFDTIDVLVCDEFHKLFEYINWESNKKSKNPDEEHRMLCTQAWEGIVWCCCRYVDKTVIALTATPECILENEKYDWIIHNVPIDDVLSYETTNIDSYNNLTQLFSKIDIRKKGLVYIPRITEMLKYTQLLRQKGIKCEAIWSEANADYPMTDEQKRVNNYIIDNQMIPDDIDVLFINKAGETSINIKSHLDYVIVHNSDASTVTQARGRYRDDLDDLYYYDPDVSDDIIVPEEFLGKRLFKEDKDKLCIALDIKENGRLCKWTTVKQYLEYVDYKVEDKKIDGGKRYSIITAQN